MALKIYTKSGGRDYTERKLIKQLEEAIDKKILEDPTFAGRWKPATNIEELRALHETYCVKDIEFTDMPNDAGEKKMGANGQEITDGPEGNEGRDQNLDGLDQPEEKRNSALKIDPLNREAPTVRSYVQNNEYPDTEPTPDANTQHVDFSREPITFEEAFEIPSGEINSESQTFKTADEKKQADKKNPGAGPSGAGVKPGGQLKEPSLNPSFDSMDGAKKRKGAKKFAKYIVEAVAMLAEKGITWWATKDITEAKMVEYELSGEYDLDILVSLEQGAEVTIKTFFAIQCRSAEEVAKFTDDEKTDIIDSLAEVLLEKQIAPTPMQELAMTALTILLKKGLLAYQIQASTKSVLEQIRVQNPQPRQPTYEANTPPPPPPSQEKNAKSSSEKEEPTYEKFEDIVNPVAGASIDEILKMNPIIDTPVTTKE